MKHKKLLAIATLMASVSFAQEEVYVGHLVDFTGPTASVGLAYGAGVGDALNYVNANGGIDGTKLVVDQIDYSYKVPQAISAYKKWTSGSNKIVALQGWGTGDTEALITFVTRDKIPTYTASYSAHLTDPTGKNPKTAKPAPYNFFYGPSYSDGCRAIVKWAAGHAQETGNANPKFIHAGDNHPYPNAPKEACAEYASELGMEVLNPVVVSLKPGDFKAQCLTIKESGANYVYVANTESSSVALMKSCNTVGVDALFLGNIWAGNLEIANAIGGGDNYYFVSSTPLLGNDSEGMKVVREMADAGNTYNDKPLSNHYMQGVCTASYMVEAMKWAKANGGITGDNIKQGMYAKADWVPEGLEGICKPSTWTAEDHRGSLTVSINRINGFDLEKVTDIELEREDKWLGY